MFLNITNQIIIRKKKMNLKIKENTKLFNNYQIQLEMTINRNLIYFKDKIVNKQE